MSFLQDLLLQIGSGLGLPKPLEPGPRESCAIEVAPGLNLFLEPDERQEQLVVGCSLGEVPPGPYGSRLLMEALKANGALPPGILAYSTKSHQLVLFELVPLAQAKAEQLVPLIQKMVPRAQQWQEAIATGAMPPPLQEEGPKGGSGMFGLRR
jgi:hypothetical protein